VSLPVAELADVVGPPIGVPADEASAICSGDHAEPHRILGMHPCTMNGETGWVVRTFHPDAVAAEVLLADGRGFPMRRITLAGLYAVFIPGGSNPPRYRLRLRFADGITWSGEDGYRFLPTLGELDLHLFNEGTHRRLWETLGARPVDVDGVAGTTFAVWAPNAHRVSVVGDFCHWDGRRFPMRRMGPSGIFELFVPGVSAGAKYKYEIKTRDGAIRLKTDPLALSMEPPPNCSSIVYASDFRWTDDGWMASREGRDITFEPLAAYEVHLGSWRRVPEEGNRMLNYREVASRLIDHVKRLGFTHVELMPVAEHPLGASWGYQVTGYFAPTCRHGSPDDLRFFVDLCHRNGIGVILDWVPAHFPKDDFALRRFDGTPLYEHDDPRLGEHPDWGTLIFNYGRHEVRSFLISNALYWLKEFHIDGLRVDAVASMLYLDYSRPPGQWLPNRFGGKENIEAIEFLRAFNDAVRTECPGCFTVAEESTGWSGVTAPTTEHGLGFTFKWNMGWMHDTLQYFARDPVHRTYHHNDLTFAMLYEQTERFINPLSHDEVVHGKRSLLEKMPGDCWQKFANLRLLLAYQYTRPGKKLLFMGTELAPWTEWHYDASLDWHLETDPPRIGLRKLLERLGRIYRERTCLYRRDPDYDGFRWIDCSDFEQSVLSYVRSDGADHLVVVLNLTPVPRDDYRIGTPGFGPYRQVLNTDDEEFGGSGYPAIVDARPEPVAWHGFENSIRLRLPPLAALVLSPGCPEPGST
jgi:1,4-alpha-glucan branching enzyme